MIHNNIHKTASRSSIVACDPPFAVFLDPEDCDLENRSHFSGGQDSGIDLEEDAPSMNVEEISDIVEPDTSNIVVDESVQQRLVGTSDRNCSTTSEQSDDAS